ncbi:hypothetical protein [Ottowia sp. VDI28]|uniref:hypothetical protein n=1 Tax=Ottowia sp. VDI28 TaxID=3133968 RepID=UPI003C2E817B
MAEAWIRMRGSLLTNPRVIAMARLLLVDPDFLEWYGNDGVTQESSRGVTMRHVTVVTRVTVGALVPLWTMVNECAAHDGVLRDATLFEVDAMAGVPGFGKAMRDTGWLDELPDGGVRFPNFFEHNTVQESRSTGAKSGSQRSKEYRERKKEKGGDSPRSQSQNSSRDGVTEKSDASRDGVTTEKSREEKSNNPSSLRSEGEGADTPPPPAPAKPRRAKGEARPLSAYLVECRTAGVKPIPDDHAVRRWAQDAGIAPEMLQIAWVQFRERYTEGEKGKRKRYIDWPSHFATAVKGNWFKLWFLGESGVVWTSGGLMHKQALDAHIASKQQGSGHAPE